MNFTIRAAQSSTWKQLKTRHLLAIASVSLFAVLAGAGIAELPGKSARPVVNTAVEAVALPAVSRETPRDAVVYIVGSLPEKEALERDSTFKDWFDQPGSGASTVSMRAIVIEAGGEESLVLLGSLVPEAGMTTGRGARLALFDLR